MPKVGIITGLLLIGIGAYGFVSTGMESVTALIPAFVGVFIGVPSFISLCPKHLKMGMHIAAMCALIGTLAAPGKIIPSLIKGTFEMNIPNQLTLLMSAVCLVFLVLCVKSFIDVRKNKNKTS